MMMIMIMIMMMMLMRCSIVHDDDSGVIQMEKKSSVNDDCKYIGVGHNS